LRAEGTTQPQTADITIGNSGSGSLTWTAASDAAWLVPSALNGAAPYTLTVTASVTGMTAGTSRDATLTLTGSPGPGQPDQVIKIPVHIAMGAVWNNAPALPIYLPLLRKAP
jgi:hypothetical protein